MKNKKMLFAILAVVLVVAALVAVYALTRPEPQVGEKTITVTVVHKDGTEKVFTYHTDAERLGEVLYGEGLIKAENIDDGMFNIVDGEKADWNTDQSYWALYQGEGYANAGVDTLVIADGDSFKLVYTIG